MDCPFLKYVDGAWLSYEHFCKASGQKIGDENNKSFVDNTCKNSHFYSCPVYKKLKG